MNRILPYRDGAARRRDRLQVSVSGPSALREASHRRARRPHQDRGSAGVSATAEADHRALSPITIPPRRTIRSSTIFRPPAATNCFPACSRSGPSRFSATFTTARSSCRPDKYFAMGDNRDHSWDSRYWGFVDREAIMGRPVVIYWSVKADENDYALSSFGGAIVSLIQYAAAHPHRHPLEPHVPHRPLTLKFARFRHVI